MTFGLVYAFDENFVLPLSHDEVVHGKRSIIGRMPGDEWQQFANLRAYYAFMYAHPGKKLLFMGNEIGQRNEWNHDQSLDWHLLQYPLHAGVQTLIRELNALYRKTPALYEIDFDARGFEWLDWNDRESSVLSWLRRDASGNVIIVVTNLTPIVRDHYRIGVPGGGEYEEVFNTDCERYGGSGIANGRLHTTARPHQGRADSIELRLPALATLFLKPVNGA
jgi:1,4-alpha-glucan branching enzyme